MGLPAEDRDLSAYQLSARVLGDLGISGGVLSRYHQQRQGKPGYERGLEMLEYDMLYGEHYSCPPYEPTQLQMGLVDGDELDTVPDGENALRAELDEPPEPGAAITVRQRAQNMTGVLAESEAYVWPEQPDEEPARGQTAGTAR